MTDDLSPIEKANLANMLAKLKAGKVLTKEEERRLTEYQEKQSARNEAATQNKTDKAPVLSSALTLSDVLGVTTQRLSQLVTEKIAVRAGKKYDLKETAKRYIQNLKARQTGRILDPEEGGDGKPRSLEAAKLQKVIIETKRQQLAFDVDSGKLIDAASVRESGVRMGALLSATLQSKPSAWAPLLAGKGEDDIQEILMKEVSVMLEMLREEFVKRATACQ